MIAAAPHFQTNTGENRELEHLLLGDLRQILEEPAGPHTSSWLIAILDMLLVCRVEVCPANETLATVPVDRYQPRNLESGSLMEKLRRLRDRVAHRSVHTALANEIREELREVMRDRMGSAGCLYDA